MKEKVTRKTNKNGTHEPHMTYIQKNAWKYRRKKNELHEKKEEKVRFFS